MSPRTYRAEGRRAAAEETRGRILEAARSILNGPGPISFSVESVASRADVARMTVYNHFGSKGGLVEALSDELAVRGGIGRLPEAFRAPDARAGLRRLVEVFVGFWDREQVAIRRLRALSAIDPELEHGNRDQRRRQAISSLAQRLASESGGQDTAALDRLVDCVWVLTSFDSFEQLSSTDRSADQVVELIWSGVEALLDSIASEQRQVP